jgi:hypothetical protein
MLLSETHDAGQSFYIVPYGKNDNQVEIVFLL